MHVPETREFDNSTDCDRISDFALQAHDDEDNDNNDNMGDRGADSSAAGNGVGCSPLSKPLEVASFSQNNNNSAQYSPPEPPTPADNLPASTAVLTSSNAPAQELPQETPAARETAGLPTIEEHQFSLDGPVTRIGRKRRARDLPSILQVCICGHTVQGGEKSSNEGVIQCKAMGCETGWVSVEIPIKIRKETHWANM